MTNEHTPAPWKARWIMHNHNESQYMVTHKNLHEEGEANAKLIAAAPDLLAALISLDEFYSFYSSWELRDEAAALFEKAHAAITKATQ